VAVMAIGILENKLLWQISELRRNKGFLSKMFLFVLYLKLS
jgi:hypothetical protein